MSTTSNEPLLGTPKTKSVKTKTLLVLLSIAAFIGTTAIVSYTISNVNQPTPRFLKTQSSDATNLQKILQKSLSHIQDSIEFTHNVNRRINDPNGQVALANCLELMDLSKDRVFNSMISLQNLTSESHSDVHTWLSSVLTNHVTCLDGLTGSARVVMEHSLDDLIERARKSLAFIVKLSPSGEPIMAAETLRAREFPSWVTRNDRKLLQSSGMNVQPNVVVAKDGSGKYSTVQAAVNAAPVYSNSRYVIYVKKGVYKEQVTIGKNKTNLMIVGDGMDATTITGSLNYVDNTSTFDSGTVIAVGDGFIAQDIGFQNTAGPIKEQAVALRVRADQSVINRVKLDAFQDTLYAHSLRQFYRDCYITGTVDFIFGDAAMVIQNSKIAARKPLPGQSNMCTAQGRTDPNSNTGISIQNCDVIASSDLQPVKGSFPTYLGRPWKEYSRTVYMQSNIGDHISPTGWSLWNGDKEFAIKTLYYGEYMNKGPGAGTGGRVNWPGYHVIKSAAEASKFTVAQFIQGGVWLKNTGVAYTEGL